VASNDGWLRITVRRREARAGILPDSRFGNSDPITRLSVRITTGRGLFDGESPEQHAARKAVADVIRLLLVKTNAMVLQPIVAGKVLDLSLDASPLSKLGVGDDVWVDIGGTAWRIAGDGTAYPNGFDRASTVKVDLDLQDFNDLGRGTGAPLTVDDITYVRLVKKGIFGWVNAPDSVEAMFFPNGLSPAAMIAEMAGQKLLEQQVLTEYNATIRNRGSARSTGLGFSSSRPIRRSAMTITLRARRPTKRFGNPTISRSAAVAGSTSSTASA
jgi:hypothetical protein